MFVEFIRFFVMDTKRERGGLDLMEKIGEDKMNGVFEGFLDDGKWPAFLVWPSLNKIFVVFYYLLLSFFNLLLLLLVFSFSF